MAQSSGAFFVGKSHWRVVNFRFVCRVITWICAISHLYRLLRPEGVGFRGKGPRRALNQFNCAEAN